MYQVKTIEYGEDKKPLDFFLSVCDLYFKGQARSDMETESENQTLASEETDERLSMDSLGNDSEDHEIGLENNGSTKRKSWSEILKAPLLKRESPRFEDLKEDLQKSTQFKILVIGDSNTGKTSIINRYVHNKFSDTYKTTIGVDFGLKIINWENDMKVRLKIWDLAGADRFQCMTRVYYKDANGAIVVFDASNPQSFNGAIKWKQFLDSRVMLPNEKPVPCLIIANKCDLTKRGVINDPELLSEYSRRLGFFSWFETSAKEGTNIEEAFLSMVRKMMENREENLTAANEAFTLSSEQTKKSSKCSC